MVRLAGAPPLIDFDTRTMRLKVTPQLMQEGLASFAVKLDGTLLSYLA